MGFLWWGTKDVDKAKNRPVEWTFMSLPKDPAPAPPGQDDEEYYVTIDLDSMRVPGVSRGYTKLYGVVHSFISAPTFGAAENAEFRAVTLPDHLKDKDATNLDGVLQLKKRLLGPIPYRGGQLKLEVGLFSVKSADLIDPYLKLLQEMSGQAGVAFVQTALPFVGLLKKGLDLLTGNAADSTLEIGLTTELEQPQPGWFLVMAGPKDLVKDEGLSVDPADGRLLGKDGNAYVTYPYMLFQVSTSLQRSDWFQIPELVAPHAKIRQALGENDLQRARRLVDQFEWIAKACPDLISDDAKTVVAKLKNWYDLTTKGGLPKDAAAEALDVGALSELDLYR
jgi:hypothetical protein